MFGTQMGGIQAMGDQMKDRHLSEQSIDELWTLHEHVVRILSHKMADEKALLEKRLKELQQQSAASSEALAKRPYPPVKPKYRNPARPSETWAGRGKQPRWVAAALKKGKRLQDLRITA
jgi:DNA-binding protein H-NS